MKIDRKRPTCQIHWARCWNHSPTTNRCTNGQVAATELQNVADWWSARPEPLRRLLIIRLWPHGQIIVRRLGTDGSAGTRPKPIKWPKRPVRTTSTSRRNHLLARVSHLTFALFPVWCHPISLISVKGQLKVKLSSSFNVRCDAGHLAGGWTFLCGAIALKLRAENIVECWMPFQFGCK